MGTRGCIPGFILKARLKGTHLWFGNSLLSLVSLTFFCSDSVWKMKKHDTKTSVSVSSCRNLRSLSTASHTRYRCVYCFKKHYVTCTAAVSYHRAVPIFPIRFPLLRSCSVSYVPMLCSWTHFFMFTRMNTILFADMCVNLLLLTPTGTSTNKTFIFILRFSLILHYKIFFFPSSLDPYQTYIRYTVMPN